MKRRLSKLPLISALLLLSACGPSNYVVLLADDDGKIGAVTVKNAAGSQVINHALSGTGFDSIDRPPSAPFSVTETEVKEEFGRALAVEPRKPKTFLLYFGTDEMSPNDESMKLIPSILETIKDWTVPNIAIVGHADKVGAPEYNDIVARQRATSVHDLITNKGVAASIIEVSSHGANNPLIPTPPNTPEPRNRRVEVTVR
ncbi:OmpA family protein [Azospirillaceae bacterium]